MGGIELPKIEDEITLAKMSVFLNLYKRIYEMPYTEENINSMQDLCFLMNEMGVACGDYRFIFYLGGPFSQRLRFQTYKYFEEGNNDKNQGIITFDQRTDQAINFLNFLKNQLDHSRFSSLEVEKKQDVIYFMHAIATAKYIIEYMKHVNALKFLNQIGDKEDVNEMAIVKAKKIEIIS